MHNRKHTQTQFLYRSILDVTINPTVFEKFLQKIDYLFQSNMKKTMDGAST